MTRPNILWILSDQHHAACWGAGGRSDVHTPALDRLSAEGTTFTSAYCNNPICAPSRCSMIAGQYPHTTGITGNDIYDLPLDPPVHRTAPQLLRQLGYQTALVGKGHMIKRWDDAGFEIARHCDLASCDKGDPTTVEYFRYLVDQGVADEFDYGTRFPGQPGYRMERFVSRLAEEHTTEAWTGRTGLDTIKRMQADPHGRPWMMQLSFQRPHDPLCIPPQRIDEYDPASLQLPANISDYFEQRFEGKPPHMRDYARAGTMGYPYRPRDEDDLRGQLAYYYTLITMIDHQIGLVIDHLKRSGQYENTLIIYAADHGDLAGEHGLILKNFGIYEAVHRVPLIVKWPAGGLTATPPGGKCSGMRELVDLYPTMLTAAGAPVPSAAEGIALQCGDAGKRDHTVCLYDFIPFQPCSVAVRDSRHRLVLYPWQPSDGRMTGELYDHDDDPGELNNRFDDCSYADVRLRLTEHILTHMSHFRRIHSMHDDPKALGPWASVLVQQKGVVYSQLQRRPATSDAPTSEPVGVLRSPH